MTPTHRKRALVLGGTGEAVALCESLHDLYDDRLGIVYSLAGLTEAPRLPEGCALRQGGFGGQEGLADYLRTERIDILINATHPYAARMSRNALEAAESLRIPLLRLDRETWTAEEGDQWLEVSNLGEAAYRVPQLGRVCMLVIGRRGYEHFSRLGQVQFIVRQMSDEMADALPLERYRLIVDAPPFTAEEELETLTTHRVEVLVARNSGGARSAAKLIAAREAGIPVLMLRRPPRIGDEYALSLDEVRQWLESRL